MHGKRALFDWPPEPIRLPHNASRVANEDGVKYKTFVGGGLVRIDGAVEIPRDEVTRRVDRIPLLLNHSRSWSRPPLAAEAFILVAISEPRDDKNRVTSK
jgi:hypothetical protein